MRVLSTVLPVVLVVGCISGCACEPNHPAFIAQEGSMVGKPVPTRWLLAKPNELGFLGVNSLSSGNIEIGWIHGWGSRYRNGECRVYYEYNPKTNIIVRWRFEGSEIDCISVC